MKTICRLLLLSAVVTVGLLWPAGAAEAETRLGIGVHRWEAVDDLHIEGIEEDGMSYIASIQVLPRGLLGFEFGLEYFDEGFGGSREAVISPQAFVLIGRGLYGGVGIGVSHSDGFEDDFSDPYYMARLGMAFHVLPRILVDVHANYQANAFDELDEADTDSVTLGAMLRFGLGG